MYSEEEDSYAFKCLSCFDKQEIIYDEPNYNYFTCYCGNLNSPNFLHVCRPKGENANPLMIDEEEYPLPPPPLVIKICNSCNEEKMVEDFRKYSLNEQRSDAYKNICIQCENNKARENKYYCPCCRKEMTMKNKSGHMITKKHKENEWMLRTINN